MITGRQRFQEYKESVVTPLNVPGGFLKILTFGTVPENKGFMEEFYGYEKYDPEENADQWLINSGVIYY